LDPARFQIAATVDGLAPLRQARRCLTRAAKRPHRNPALPSPAASRRSRLRAEGLRATGGGKERQMILGAVADDFTGASDLANTLARGGMRTFLYAGTQPQAADAGTEAGVVALKSRTIAADEAVAQSLGALDWLREQGCRQILFKYCSTFDSTDAGNIGPVSEALADALDEDAVVVCPAFPGAGRTVYRGHLFVGDRLLSESGMERHPLTPMRDPDIRRVLARQAKGPVGAVPHPVVAQGPEAIAAAIAGEAAAGRRLIVVDAISDADLIAIGRAAHGRRLVTGGSGIALGLPANFLEAGAARTVWNGAPGPAAALAGSVSGATRRQVAAHRAAGQPVRAIPPEAVMAGDEDPEALAAWALSQSGVPLVHSEAEPAAVAAAQDRYGREAVADAFERLMSATAQALVARGLRRLVVAGGETSGAVVTALQVGAMEVGPEIDPGVPALLVRDRGLALALKSGNFGGDDFFARAAERLGGGA
jgi:uncharacterized protein YgbK (DUF1537 family)